MNIKKTTESVLHIVFLLLGLVTVGCVLVITVYLVLSGIKAPLKIGIIDFIFGKEWSPTADEPRYGILPFILTSVYGTAGAVAIGVPIGFFASVYLSKLAPAPVRTVTEGAIELLSAIPSVIYGLVGMLLLVPLIGRIFGTSDGSSLLAAMLVLSVMILPNVIKVSLSALDAVPKEYEAASLALGASDVETYFGVSVMCAKSGIASSVVLGIGRAVGEAMAVMMVSGNVANMPKMLGSVRFLTSAVASEMSYATPESLHRNALFSIALVLYLFILLINAVLHLFLKKGKRV